MDKIHYPRLLLYLVEIQHLLDFEQKQKNIIELIQVDSYDFIVSNL